MKILCISDQIDPVVYTDAVKARFGDIDLILGAGDLPFEYLDFIVSSLNKPLLFVLGNHDPNPSRKKSPFQRTGAASCGAIPIGSRIRVEEGLIFAGLGGSMRYNNGDNQYTEGEMRLSILKILPALLFNRLFRGRFLDVLLTHAPPFGIHDRPDRCHRGFKPFLWFMRTFKPKYLIHGHIHLYDLSETRVSRYHATSVINAYGHYVIDIPQPPARLRRFHKRPDTRL
ncbi:MAG: metallophosphoesterase [Spirochaetaceae bacterium]|nr:metallophosphoesterase [Spirochaetaceae bacterium]